MSLLQQAEATLGLTVEGPLSVEVSLTDPAVGVLSSVRGRVTRVDEQIDQMSSVRVHEPATRVTLRLSSLPTEPKDGWGVATTDIAGNPIVGVLRSPEFDRKLGLVTAAIEIVTTVAGAARVDAQGS